MGFVRSVPIKSYENLIKISWWPWDLSDQFPSNPMSILSKSHGDHGICQIKSYQIQWVSYQNLMNTHGVCQISSHQILWVSYQNLMVTHGVCQISSHQILWVSYQNLMVTMGFVRSVPIKSYENLITISWWPWDLSDQILSNPMRILSKSHGHHEILIRFS